jgi:hypothetical protein
MFPDNVDAHSSGSTVEELRWNRGEEVEFYLEIVIVREWEIVHAFVTE